MLFTPGQRDLLFRNPDISVAETAAASQCDRLRRALPLDPVNRVSYLESRCYMLNTLLRDADFMSMSQGLEVRVPLIDHQLAKAVLALPGAWKLNATPKKLLVVHPGIYWRHSYRPLWLHGSLRQCLAMFRVRLP
jgi:hypothetical protein